MPAQVTHKPPPTVTRFAHQQRGYEIAGSCDPGETAQHWGFAGCLVNVLDYRSVLNEVMRKRRTSQITGDSEMQLPNGAASFCFLMRNSRNEAAVVWVRTPSFAADSDFPSLSQKKRPSRASRIPVKWALILTRCLKSRERRLEARPNAVSGGWPITFTTSTGFVMT